MKRFTNGRRADRDAQIIPVSTSITDQLRKTTVLSEKSDVSMDSFLDSGMRLTGKINIIDVL